MSTRTIIEINHDENTQPPAGVARVPAAMWTAQQWLEAIQQAADLSPYKTADRWDSALHGMIRTAVRKLAAENSNAQPEQQGGAASASVKEQHDRLLRDAPSLACARAFLPEA